ncbi:similar to Saccharomyces cerevisiae YIR033W MGA2 ER membrane protein involved in regulation of OLE1 transcription, acts with homolog Spt23p [Maudiozyma saulgeensis]|uniref:Similar to Saccharomyces cerevisiae YIR033W MGA2 ER membrane protein involved in regulation of OLE1 transcription, acts with homolog Spt23p n=1 Tax=Maudiozyma saulgeensis TaxID=1789683 RepID=A0A1X7QW72_9SACH|nr:similar to Saccharomyces cerevisiae YIR033W MGA2 ER membrane protein involved in regulation of OLE1 transcription, acts with homolog Spt23p [Kazachstania saulgeensis]
MDRDILLENSNIESMVSDILFQGLLTEQEEKESPPHDDLQFGRKEAINTKYVDPAQFLAMDSAKIQSTLTVRGLPEISRVENQLKLHLTLTGGQLLEHKSMVHLPADCIAKEKLYLTNDDITTFPASLKHKLVHLEAYLLCAGSEADTTVCKRCVERELKRASRRKSGLSDNMLWCNNPHRRAIIFKNRQIMNMTKMGTKSLEFDLVARIVCYSRHNKSKEGFKLLFVVRDSEDGTVMARTVTHPIVIMDKKQSASTSTSTSTSLAEMFTSNQLFLSSELESSSPFTTVPFPSPSSLSEDSNVGSSKRSRTSIDSTGSWQQAIANIATLPTPQDEIHAPTIQRIIPAQGPINGGIEITLLGKNFKQGQRIKFGENIALSTQCWNDSTMVTYLPPASTPGQVVVTIEDKPGTVSQINVHQLASLQLPPQSPQTVNLNAIFTYVDDTDRQLIELALQIVGLKMNGKLEDARNIAKRIVGTSSTHSTPSPMSSSAGGYTDDESLIVNVLTSFKIGSKNLNLSVCDPQGRTLLHHAALKSYHSLLRTLINYGAYVERPDLFGFTPLHLACVAGDYKTIEMLYEGCHCAPSAVTINGMTAKTLLWINHHLKWNNMFDTENDTTSQLSLSAVSSFTDLYSQTNITVPMSNDSDDAMADDENESETYEDKSVLTETEEDIDTTSLWNRMVTNLTNNDLLPKYEDLFPKGLLDLNTKANTLLQQDQPHVNIEDEESEEEGDDLEDLRNSVQQFFLQQRTKFQNDSMLLFFWIPLMVILICSMTLYTLGHDDNFIQTLGDRVSKYLRMGLSHVILGNERMKTVVRKQFQTFQTPHVLPEMTL